MALKTYHAQAKHLSGLQVEASAGGFTVHIDEPETSGGDNSGMNPVELLLCSIASCQTITAVIFADFYGIPIQDIWIEIEGDMDSDGFTGADTSIRSGFQAIRPRFHIKSTAPELQLQQLLGMVEKMCPVGDSVGKGVTLLAPDLVLE